MTAGHVFVVRGRIGKMVADAAVISTDADFWVEDYWHDVVSPEPPFSAEEHRPASWEERGWGRSPARESVWFVDVTAEVRNGGDGFDRLRSTLEDIAQSQLQNTIKGRPMPLVVVPVIGTKGGGFSRQRGEVIDRLLAICSDLVATQPIDVAVVATNAATYAALQYRRREEHDRYFDTGVHAAAERLGAAAREGSLALFLGAGTSIPAGAPSWRELIDALAAEAGVEGDLRASFDKLNPLDQTELLHQRLGTHLSEAITAMVSGKLPALAHLLLAALGCQSAVTTNYDGLYEAAVTAGGGDAATVLPTQIPRGNGRWLLKMHGDLKAPRSIVLTRGQFVGFPAASAPSGAVLQSLLLTRHLLVVGASMTDDNLLRLIHEVAAYRAPHRQQAAENPNSVEDGERYGTVLDVDAEPAREELHSRHFHWLSMPGSDVPDRARQLEIFLDAVAMHASSNHSWLLDERFSYLHQNGNEELAVQARELADSIRDAATSGTAWGALLARLEEFGASLLDRDDD